MIKESKAQRTIQVAITLKVLSESLALQTVQVSFDALLRFLDMVLLSTRATDYSAVELKMIKDSS